MSKKILKNFEGIFAGVLLCVMLIVGMWAVIMRYVFNNSLTWSEEFLRYGLVWFAYMAATFAVTTRSHLSIDLLTGMVTKNKNQMLGKVIVFIGKLIWLAFSIYITIIGFDSMATKFILGEPSIAMGFPMWILYLVVPLSFGLMSLRLIFVIAEDYKILRGEDLKIKSEGLGL